MKYNDVLPECYIDTMLIGTLLNADVNHKYGCNEIAKDMKKGRHKDDFAIGIIDNDKRTPPYADDFDEVGKTENMIILKHKKKHQYMIKIGQEHKAIETFIKANVEAIGMTMEKFDLPSDLDALTDITKNSITTRKDPRILKVCKAIQASPEVARLKDVLDYLISKKYTVDVNVLKEKINQEIV